MAEVDWLATHDALRLQCNATLQAIQHHMRDGAMDSASRRAQSDLRLKREVAKMNAAAAQLSESLQAAHDALERGDTSKISRLELQRRKEMVLTISQRLEYMAGLVNQSPAEPAQRRPQPRASHDQLGISRDASDQSIITMQSEGLAQQDGLMDVLAASASRQKEIARAIAGELKDQDVILEDLEDEVDDAEQGLLSANKRASSVLQGSKRRDMTVCSIGCLVIILIILFLVLMT